MKKSFLLLILLLVILDLFLAHTIVKRINSKKIEEIKIQKNLLKENKIKDITNHYNKYVKTIKEANLYEYKNNKYIKIGRINKNIELELENININEKKEYFKIKNLNYFIKYNYVEKIENISINDRYKKYVLFNQNVVTDIKTTLYNELGYAYQIDSSVSLPLIIEETDRYYVSYNNTLLYIKKSESKLKYHKNTSEKTRNNIRTFTYHAVYKENEKCKNKAICHPYKQFDSQMKYLSENNYLTLTMEELEMFLDKKINIPIKTVVITLDDGNLAKNAIEILEKYKLYATYFIITGRYDSYKLKSTYVSFESHTNNLHNNYKCPGGEQGGQLLCEDKNKILDDLKISKQKLNGSKYFSYPFFDWNERAINLLKQSGFHLAFIGQWTTDGYSDYNTNRLLLKRKTIFANDSLETFKSYLK